MNSYDHDESKQIELASSSNSIMSSPSQQPEVHNSSKLRSEYDQLRLYGGYGKTRRYTTEGTETETITEWEDDESMLMLMETTKGGDCDHGDDDEVPEIRMLTS